MISRIVSLAFFLAPTLALAVPVTAGSAEETDLGSRSVQSLCANRSDSDNWAEIQRREVFDERELWAIEREQLQGGISVEALQCIVGAPLAEISMPRYQRLGTVDYVALVFEDDEQLWAVLTVDDVVQGAGGQPKRGRLQYPVYRNSDGTFDIPLVDEATYPCTPYDFAPNMSRLVVC